MQTTTHVIEIDGPVDHMNLTQQSVEGLLEQLQIQNRYRGVIDNN
jgi:hypothetical protein